MTRGVTRQGLRSEHHLILPTGTITFLFTDIEGSTELWEQHPALARSALKRHDEIIETVVRSSAGVVVKPRGEGDSRFVVFTQSLDLIHRVVVHRTHAHHPTAPPSGHVAGWVIVESNERESGLS